MDVFCNLENRQQTQQIIPKPIIIIVLNNLLQIIHLLSFPIRSIFRNESKNEGNGENSFEKPNHDEGDVAALAQAKSCKISVHV